MGTQVNIIGKPRPNLLINSGFDFWQRIGSGGTGAIVVSATYFADRWCTFYNGSSGGTAATVARSTDAPTGIPYSCKIQRTAGNTNVTGIYHVQAIEYAVTSGLMGKTLTYSFWAKAGANYSPTSSRLQAGVSFGTTASDPAATGGLTGQTTQVTSFTLTTSWQRFTATVTVPVGSPQMRVYFLADHTGTAGADDSHYIAGVSLNEGGAGANWQRQGNDLSAELIKCQRFFEKSYNTDVAVGSVTSVNRNILHGRCPSTVAIDSISQPFKVTKRGGPTMTFYRSDTGASGVLLDHTSAGVAATANSVGVNSFAVGTTAGAGYTAGQAGELIGHWTAEAEL